MTNLFKVAIINEFGKIVGYIGYDDCVVNVGNTNYVTFDNLSDCVCHIRRFRDLVLDSDSSNEFVIIRL